MAEDKRSLEDGNDYDDLRGFFPEEYDLSPEELLSTPDCDSFESSDASPIWEDLNEEAVSADSTLSIGDNQSDNIENANTSENENTEINTEKKKQSFIKDIYDILEMFAVCAACIIIFFSFFARLTIVDGDSMNDTLVDGEWLIISDFLYSATPGDIVVVQDTSLDHPELKKPLVKRIIAIGGQTVDISSSGVVTITEKDGSVSVLDETYTKDEPYLKSEAHFEIQEGYIFVMGDNRNVSTDSRDSRVGLIDERCIIGCAHMRIFPIENFGILSNPLEKE